MAEPDATLTVEPLLYEVTVTMGQSVPDSRLLPAGPYQDGDVLTIAEGAAAFLPPGAVQNIDGGTFN